MDTVSAPALSTPAEHIFKGTSVTLPQFASRLSEEQLYVQYEIQRTVREIRDGRWKRIALQFPDDMLVDAPRVFERLGDGLRARWQTELETSTNGTSEDVTACLEKTSLDDAQSQKPTNSEQAEDERLTILADTSYGACCVDEVAAEHVDADVVVHYGRSCLSPTARLPVIYVFTTKPLDMEATIAGFKETYKDPDEKVCLMADIPYTHHIPTLYQRLSEEGYTNVFATEVVRNPSSLLPNRTIPPEAQQDAEALKHYSVFHISSPPTSLLLIIFSRVQRIHVFPTSTSGPTALESSTSQLLRRRYALIIRLSTVPVFGILINTLSVANYMDALRHCQDLISRAGKKSYVFVVGKVNPAKLANFAEIGGWVVIGCWESSLIESEDFYRPIITPFELEVALTPGEARVWGAEWVGDFSQLLGREKDDEVEGKMNESSQTNGTGEVEGDGSEEQSDDEPPEFDLRTGRYVSRSRPMHREMSRLDRPSAITDCAEAPPSSALVQRAKGDLASINGGMATINGTVSPAADFLRSKRTWQGLGSDYKIAYERDEDGKIMGAAMEEGRAGVARGYVVGQAELK